MKFFLFRREDISEGSVKSSDNGIGLSVFAIPASQMAFMTAIKGAIDITFNNASIYERTALLEGESFEKTSVTISCVEGRELALMEDILNFIVAENPRRKIMKFDVETGKSLFDSAISKSISDVSTHVKINAIVTTSGEISKGDAAKEYQGTIGEIYFGADKPSLDFNHEGLSGYADGAEITAWENAGTGGSTYSIAANVGDPRNETGLTDIRGLARTNALIAFDDYFVVPNAYKVTGEYTAYMAFTVTDLISGLGVLYGDDSGETMGFCFGDAVYDANGGITKVIQALNTFKIRHDGRTSEPASVSTSNEQTGTISYKFPENLIDGDAGETCHVFVIRRDKDSNMYLHNRGGEVVAFIPGVTQAATPSGKRTDTPGMTDGDLLIEQIGSGGGIVDSTTNKGSFRGALARFGVIEKDIGTSKSGQLAQDLFNLYNF